MNRIVGLGEFLFWGILGGAVFIITLKAANRRINLKGLLRSSPNSGISAARVQLLFSTLVGAFGYLELVVNSLAIGDVNPNAPSLPDFPSSMLAALGGSSGFYLGAKGLITGAWLDRLRGII